jgi:hypothetical protein
VLAASELDRLDAVLGLGADVEARALEQLTQVEADDRLVFGYENADGPSLSRPLVVHARAPHPRVGMKFHSANRGERPDGRRTCL